MIIQINFPLNFSENILMFSFKCVILNIPLSQREKNYTYLTIKYFQKVNFTSLQKAENLRKKCYAVQVRIIFDLQSILVKCLGNTLHWVLYQPDIP